MPMESESRDNQHQAEVCAGTYQSDYAFIKEEDVSGLTEALAEVAHKWEEIAVALRLPKAVIEECREKSSDISMKLYNVLHTWVENRHFRIAKPTMKNLKAALACPLVQHCRLASELEEKFKTSLNSHTLFTSPKKPLFSTWVEEVLVERYLQCTEVPCGSWPPIVSETFINLALIETSGQPSKSDYSIRGDGDDVLAEKTLVQYEDVFQEYQAKRKLLILGRPGSGKTTLVHKLVRDWSAGKALQGAELVFLISLRMLSSIKKCDLAQLLYKYFYDEQKLEEVVSAIKRVRGKNVCFVFDDSDEYSPQDIEESVIFPLLDKSYLVDSMIVVTSRPAAASAAALVLDNSYNKIEVFGLSKSQIEEYINTFPFCSSPNVNEAQSKKLLKYLSSHPGVLDLCYLPVYCAIICYIYSMEPDDLPDTQTQIYALFTRLIIIRHLTNKDMSRQLNSLEDLQGQEAEDFKKLCSLAFDMTTQSQQVISSPASTDEAHSLGLITADTTAGLSEYNNSYSFLHLTLQEFLAAYHLSKLNQEEQMSHIEKYSKTVRMLTVWKFYFGLVNFNTGLDRAKKLFSVLRSINMFGPNEYLFPIQCSYEARQAAIYRLAASEKFEFFSILNDYNMSAIVYTMSMAATEGSLATPIKCLKFCLSALKEDKLKILINRLSDRALQYLETLVICDTHITVSDIETLGGRMKLRRMQQVSSGRLNNLKHLTLSGGITDEYMTSLATGLDGNHVLESLDLSRNHISVSKINELMKSDCRLMSLNLSYNILKDEGVIELCSGLDGNHVLEKLYLAHNCISVVGVGELLKLDCHLRHLDLSDNIINDDGAIALARGLRGNLTLKSINVSHSKIGDVGVDALALAIRGNTLRLDLSSNLLGILLQPIIADSPSTEKELNNPQSCGGDPETKCDEEVSQIPRYCNLEELDISRNNIGGRWRPILSKFTSLFHLKLSPVYTAQRGTNIPAAMDVVEFVASSDNCLQLKYLWLSPYLQSTTRTLSSCSNSCRCIYLNIGPGFMVDLSENFFLNKTIAVTLLREWKKCDRVRAVCLDQCCISDEEFADLKNTYQYNEDEPSPCKKCAIQ